jgi:calcineurin-like phosphoesterase family protein
MHDAIKTGWNETIGKDDIVIYLGDLSFAKAHEKQDVKDFINDLNGTIHYVMGNHDRMDEIQKMGRFKTVQDYLEVRVGKYENGRQNETLFCCMHYPIFSWNKGHHGSYMVHGHCHGNLHHGEDASLYDNRRIIDVGCMLTDYRPIEYTEIMEKLKHVVLPDLKRKEA